ncbi:MAG: DNA translocase FtsK, partial [Bacteroidetes bacterium]|nr:DNA translocase FtsK [Bacteroidota bacterium]
MVNLFGNGRNESKYLCHYSKLGRLNRFKSETTSEEKAKKKFRLKVNLNEQNQKLLGVALLGSSMFFLLAFISFLFSFKSDFSLVESITGEAIFTINPKAYSNWMGLLGSWFSYKFIYSWFGITAFALPFLLFLWGVKFTFKTSLLTFSDVFEFLVFGILWLPVFTSVLAQGAYDYIAGGFGVYANLWLKTMVGAPGLVIVLAVALIGFVLVKFNTTKLFAAKQAGASTKQFEEQNQEEEKLTEKPKQPKPTTKQEKATEEPEKTIEFETSFKDFEPEEEFLDDDDTDNNESSPIELTSAVTQPSPIRPLADSSMEVEGLEIEKAVDTDEKVTTITHNDTDYDPTLDLSRYKFPTLELLKEYEVQQQTIDASELEQRKDLIVNTLANYKIEIDKIKATIGPTVTLFEIIPAPGVRISKIKNLEDDIALSLSALGIRIIAPIPGKGTIGIEVPNAKPEMVSMRDVVSSSKFQNTDKDLPIVFGRTISNEIYVADLAKMPHLLMAGATGQGKSVGLNVIITSLLYKKHPSQVKFVLVDPKKVELTLYKHIERHFLAKLPDEEEAIITDTSKVIDTLNSLCAEMDQRYDLLKEAQVRNIKEYNQKFLKRRLNPENGHRFLPYIVLVIDELADLMMTAGKEVETPIARLAQLARAIGIHLIIATQRPSVNIITGIIKANFPTRLAFRVTSKVDSRTILDSGGADQLIGRGDMLYSEGGEP